MSNAAEQAGVQAVRACSVPCNHVSNSKVGRTVRKKRHARLRELERMAASTIQFTAPLRPSSDAELAHAPDLGYGAPELPVVGCLETKPVADLQVASAHEPRQKRRKQTETSVGATNDCAAAEVHAQQPQPVPHKSSRKRKNKFKTGTEGSSPTLQAEPTAHRATKCAAAKQGQQDAARLVSSSSHEAAAGALGTRATPAHSNARHGSSGALSKMRSQLHGGRFRMLNEQLYTTDGASAYSMMQDNPALFDAYHEGFRAQTGGWRTNPVDVAIAWLRRKQGKLRVVADFGCGDAKIAAELAATHVVHSFDLVARNERVVACNIASVPLETGSSDVAVFSLALMGQDYPSFLKEAERVLKPSGWLWIAEVRSRFVPTEAEAEDFTTFIACLKQLGFRKVKQDLSNKMFVVWTLQKVAQCQHRAEGTRWPSLAPCIYKRR